VPTQSKSLFVVKLLEALVERLRPDKLPSPIGNHEPKLGFREYVSKHVRTVSFDLQLCEWIVDCKTLA
jgi:hypothetical protein